MKMQKAKVSIKIVSGPENEEIFKHTSSPLNHTSILKQWQKIKERPIINLEVPKAFPLVERVHITNITNPWYVAIECFGIQRYDVTILFASIPVETLLNHDERMFSYRVSLPDKWIHLSVKNLIIAKEVGMDVSDLLKKRGRKYFSHFVERRNKLAHGDLVGYSLLNIGMSKMRSSTIEETGVTEKQAMDQLRISFNFIKKWGESNPTVVLGKMETLGTGVVDDEV